MRLLTDRKIWASQVTEFKTLSPPYDGTCTISPAFGNEGDTFTINCNLGWKSGNGPIVYKSWQKGSPDEQLHNVDIGKAIADPTSFVIKNAGPIMIEITDKSQEKTTITLTPKVTMLLDKWKAEFL